MKRMLLLVTLLVNVAGFSLQAADDPGIGKHIRQSFRRHFPSAEWESWSVVKNEGIYLVRFVFQSQSVVAYLSPDGSLLATARTTHLPALPMPVSQKLSRQYASYSITEAVEMMLYDELGYLLTLENDKQTVYLWVYPTGEERTIKKSRK